MHELLLLSPGHTGLMYWLNKVYNYLNWLPIMLVPYNSMCMQLVMIYNQNNSSYILTAIIGKQVIPAISGTVTTRLIGIIYHESLDIDIILISAKEEEYLTSRF